MNKVIINDKLSVQRIDKRIYGLSQANQMNYHYGNGDCTYGEHGLIVGAHAAFQYHLELSIKPDDILQCVIELVSKRVNESPKKYKDKIMLEGSEKGQLMTKDGKIRVIISRPYYERDVSKNPWEDCFEEFSEKIGELTVIKPISFTTSTPIDFVSRSIATMESVKSYISFEVMTRCGIRAINRLGTQQDWLNMIEYSKHLLSLVDLNKDKFFDKLMSDDKDVWRDFYVFDNHRGSGGPYRGGWILELLDERKKIESSVEFIWDYFGERIDMRFITGFGNPLIEDGIVSYSRYWGVIEDKLLLKEKPKPKPRTLEELEKSFFSKNS